MIHGASRFVLLDAFLPLVRGCRIIDWHWRQICVGPNCLRSAGGTSISTKQKSRWRGADEVGLRFKEPKTAHGRRTISLPATAVTELRAHRLARQVQRLALGAGKSPPTRWCSRI
jgi:hypothetical protein